MANIITTLTADPNETLRDYQHAADTFNVSNYQLLPKTKRWFAVNFEINPAATATILPSLQSAISAGRINWTSNGDYSYLSVLTKSISLPNFTFEVKKHNQYNRASLNVSKINYNPIDVSFHDDSISMMDGFWYSYYQYMIQDPAYSQYSANQAGGLPIPLQWDQYTSTGSTLYKTVDNFTDRFGLDTITSPPPPPPPSKAGQAPPAKSILSVNRNAPFFKNIRIYQFIRATNPNKGATYNEYILVNPVISGFRHDTLDYSSSDFTTNSMTIEFETVLYSSGILNSNELAFWTKIKSTYFDNSSSPNGENLINLISGVATDVATALGANPETLSAINTLPQATVATLATGTLNNSQTQLAVTAALSQPTSASQTILVPNSGS